jgi:hypothetical protein
MNSDYDYNNFDVGQMVQVWGPRILGAILILVVAWLVGRALKWALARGINKIPAVAKHSEGADPKATPGARLGEVVYWLVLLVGIVAALSALQLAQVAAPLNTMLYGFFSYLPNVVGAALIFFIGFIVATLARRVITALLEAANLERWMSKVGLSGLTGGALPSAIGTLVFVLILIPVTIAALETLGIEAISGPAIAVLSTVLAAIPNVLAAAIVLFIGFLIGRWVASVVERVLPATGFDKAMGALTAFSSHAKPSSDTTQAAWNVEVPAGQTQASELPPTPPATSASKVVGNVVLFAIVAFSAIEAARLLQFGAIAAILEDILGLAGRVIVGGVIITAGVLIADMLSNAIDRSTSGADRFASTLVKWATIALAAAMGLRFMGIADEIVILAFGLILGSAAVAGALAFGLGGRDAAGKLANRWVSKAEQKSGSPPAI